VPDSLEDVLSLNGVGMKMAALLMKTAFDKTIAIGVDTHVHRISN
jgi:endonuclease III